MSERYDGSTTPEQHDGMTTEGYSWVWPPIPVQVNQLGEARGLVDMLSNSWEGQAANDVMSGSQGPVDAVGLERIYRQGLALKRNMQGGIAKPKEVELYEALRDSMLGWFCSAPWMVQPTTETHSFSSQGVREDTRYHRLLLPAHMINFLTKLVETGVILDVSRKPLEDMSKKAYQQSSGYLNADYLKGVKKSLSSRRISNPSYDMQEWGRVDPKKVGGLVGRATRIRDNSYTNNMQSFKYPNASGLYFMKSILIATMQEWYQQREGIDLMIPPISNQESIGGYSSYDFRTNGTNSTDMHTSDKRFPFNRYVAHYLQEANKPQS